MEYVPPGGRADLATKTELNHLYALDHKDALYAKLDYRFDALQAEMNARFDVNEARFEAAINRALWECAIIEVVAVSSLYGAFLLGRWT